MKLFTFYNMERTRFGRWFMEGYPAKYHAFLWMGFMTFTGPKERVSESLVKHELIHHYQAKREGWLRWNVRYYRQLWKVGYLNIDYEVEAYDRMHEPLTWQERKLLDLPERTNVWTGREYAGYSHAAGYYD